MFLEEDKNKKLKIKKCLFKKQKSLTCIYRDLISK